MNSPPTGQNLDIHAVPYGTGARSVKTPAGPLDFSLINYAEYIRKVRFSARAVPCDLTDEYAWFRM